MYKVSAIRDLHDCLRASHSFMSIRTAMACPLYKWLMLFYAGKIMCRLPQPSIELGQLGKHLTKIMLEHGELSFVVWEQPGLGLPGMHRQLLGSRVMERMIREKTFNMGAFAFEVQSKVIPIHISLCLGDLTTFPISGYPRPLFKNMTNDNTTRNPSQTSLSAFPTGLHAIKSTAARYTHGSRRLKKVAAWEPPALLERASLTDLWSYGDPNRVIGSDVIKPGPVYAEQSHESSLPEAFVPMRKDAAAPVASPTTAPQQSVPPQSAPQQPALEQGLKRTALLSAFRALLWPIRARPAQNDSAIPTDMEDWVMSHFVEGRDGRRDETSEGR